jgi:murein DD-endopeptidase MepM/ murein hydrolase activator NlpD
MADSTDQASRQTQRDLKKISPDANRSEVVSFLEQLNKTGLIEDKEYLVPTLEQRQKTTRLRYSSRVELAYRTNQTDDLLLPADLVMFLTQIQSSLDLTEEEQDLLKELNKIYSVFFNQNRITLEEERQVSNLVNQENISHFVDIFINKIQPQEDKSENKDEKADEESEDSVSLAKRKRSKKTATTRQPQTDGGAGRPPADSKIPDEPELVNSQVKQTVNSLTELSINSVLAAYTQAENLKDFSYQDLDPNLQQALFNQVHAQVENFILGLSQSEREAFIKEGNFELRLKLFKQTSYYLRANPQARVLLQTAIESCYHHYSNNQGKQEEILNNLQAAANKPSIVEQNLEQRAKSEEMEGEVQNLNLAQGFKDLDEFRTQFDQRLEVILGLNSASKATIARQNLDNSIASLIMSDPFLSPRFVGFLPPHQLEFFLQTKIPQEVLNSSAKTRALKRLIKQYWTVYRAKHLKKIAQENPELLLYYQDKDPEAAEEVFSDDAIKKRLAQARNIQNKTESADEDLQRLSEASEDASPDQIKASKQLYWDQLSSKKKELYLRYVYGAGYKEQLETNRLSNDDIVNDFQYLKYLQALNEVITAQAVLQNQQIAAQIGLQQVAFKLEQHAAILELEEQQLAFQQMEVIEAVNNSPLPKQISGDYANFDQHLGQRLQQAGRIGSSIEDAVLDKAVDLGVEVGTTVLLEGSDKVIPFADQLLGPIKDLVKKQLKKRLKKIIQILKAAAAALAAILAALLAIAIKLLPIILAAGGAILGMTFGPLGAVVLGGAGGIGGGLITGQTQNWFAGIKRFFGNESVRSSAGQAGRNVRDAATDLGNTGRNALRSPTNQTHLFEGGLESSVAPSEGLLANLVSNPFGGSLVSTFSTTAAFSFTVFMVIQVAFLANFPYTGVYSTDSLESESRYVQMEKTVTVNCQESEKATCHNPNFPVRAEYRVEIRPKKDYVLTITGLTDEIFVEHNKKHYQDAGKEVPTVDTETRQLEDFNLSKEELTINPDETLTLTYNERYNRKHNHANIRNKINIEFNFSGSSGSGQDEASTYSVIRLGDSPKGKICWPTSGRIVQGPYDSATHSRVDAYDIVPADGISAVHPVYAVANGEICAGRLVGGGRSGLYDSVYGNHLSLETKLDGETYVFVYGHFANGTTIVKNGCESVSAGTVIGYMGDTGMGAVHLHFERRAGYDNTYSLTKLLPGGTVVDEFPNEKNVTSCYEEGFNE